MTYESIRKNSTIRTYIEQADASLRALGYTEHSFAHVTHVAEQTGEILQALGFPPRTVELGRIAGFLHDIGNLVNREGHSQSGAIMAFQILGEMGFPPEEISAIVTAIGNHDEGTGLPVSDLSASLILADKCDVRRSRVRDRSSAQYDIHDRVNDSVESAALSLDTDKRLVTLNLKIDTALGSVMDYFEIFLERMLLCRKAAERLGLTFRLVINGQYLI